MKKNMAFITFKPKNHSILKGFYYLCPQIIQIIH